MHFPLIVFSPIKTKRILSAVDYLFSSLKLSFIISARILAKSVFFKRGRTSFYRSSLSLVSISLYPSYLSCLSYEKNS